MAITRDLPLADYPNGSRTFVKSTPNGLGGFNVSIGRCTTATPTIWPNATTTLNIKVECSYDGGATFPTNGGGAEFILSGGIALQKGGGEFAASNVSCRFEPQSPNAVRITATIAGGPLRTYVDVTVL